MHVKSVFAVMEDQGKKNYYLEANMYQDPCLVLDKTHPL